MDVPALDQLFLFLVSLAANAFSALAGGGAGLIQFPLLIFLGLPFGVALATHKIATVFLGLGAALRHGRGRHLERRYILLLLLAGVPGVALGGAAILHVPERTATLVLGVLTMGLGIYSLFSPRLGLVHAPRNLEGRGVAIGAAGLFVIGFMNGSLSSGSGLFLTLWLIRYFGLDYSRAVAYTMVIGGLFWNGTGAAVLGVLGEVAWDWLPALLLGSVLGGYLGSHLALAKGNRWIKRAFEAATILVGLKLLL